MKRLLTVSLFTALLTVLKMACGFVIAKAVAIYTGPSGMAALGQVQNIVNSLNGLVTAPAASGVVRYTAEYQEQGYEVCAPWWRASLQWIVALILIVAPLGFLFSESLSGWLFGKADYAWLIVIISCALPFSAINTLLTSVINGQQQYRRYVATGMVSVVASTSVMIALIIHANLNGALVATAIYSGVSGAVMLLCSLRQPWLKLKYWWGRTDKEHRKGIGSYVLMAMTSALAAPVALVVVRNVLIAEVGWDQAGQWEAVRRISDAYLAVITIALGTYFLPRLALLKSLEEVRKEIYQTAKVVMPLVIIMSIGVYLLRDIAISLLFTEEFSEARELFAIQLCSDVIKILSWLYAYPMLSRGAVKWFVFSEVLFSFSYVGLSYFCVQMYGLQGPPLAALINYLMYFIFVFIGLKKFFR